MKYLLSLSLKSILTYRIFLRLSVNIELSIGRDLISAHHVLDQRIGTVGLPFGQTPWLGDNRKCLPRQGPLT